MDFQLFFRIYNKVQEIHVGLKLKWTHQPMAYIGDVNLLEAGIGTIKKNTEL
jgi:hypothetical protein